MFYIAYVDSHIEVLKAIADETRFRILRVLHWAEVPLCVAEIVDIVRRPQYAVSRALATLAAAGLVTEHHAGKLRYYKPANRADGETSPFLLHVHALAAVDTSLSGPAAHDRDRLRWRLELREEGECVVTYTAGYAPAEYTAKGGKPVEEFEKRRVLFVCVHNTARSQIAEAYLRQYGGDIFEVESAGLTPGTLNPYVVRVLREDGFDISHNVPQSVFDLYKAGRTYTYVITVCSREAEEECPIFPGPVRRINWPFPDPSRFEGSDDEIMQQTRVVRDEIRDRVRGFVDHYREEHMK